MLNFASAELLKKGPLNSERYFIAACKSNLPFTCPPHMNSRFDLREIQEKGPRRWLTDLPRDLHNHISLPVRVWLPSSKLSTTTNSWYKTQSLKYWPATEKCLEERGSSLFEAPFHSHRTTSWDSSVLQLFLKIIFCSCIYPLNLI